MRVKRGIVGNRKKKKLHKMTKGFVGGRRNLMRAAKETLDKSLAYAFRDRRARKREFRQLWIARINAALRLNGKRYSLFIHDLSKAGVEIDRKILSDLAITDPKGFSFIADSVAKS
jgi:large subunit ribosomal protein L20